jgi:hypothetical protein
VVLSTESFVCGAVLGHHVLIDTDANLYNYFSSVLSKHNIFCLFVLLSLPVVFVLCTVTMYLFNLSCYAGIT